MKPSPRVCVLWAIVVLTATVGLLCAGRARAEESQALVSRPVLHIPFIKKAPTIDGKIDPAEWSDAARITGFVAYRKWVVFPESFQPVWYLAWDDTNLYFAQRMPLYPKGTLRAKTKVGDKGGSNAGAGDRMVLDEDHAEIELGTVARREDALKDHFYKLIVNPYSAVADQRKRYSVGWDGWEWESGARTASTVTDEAWTLEVALPLASLGYKTPPKDLTSIFCQLVSAQDSEFFYTSWAPGGWLDWDTFATIILDRTAPAVRVESLGALENGELNLSLGLANPGTAKKTVKAHVDVENRSGKIIYTKDESAALAPGQKQTVQFTQQHPELTLPKDASWSNGYLSGRQNIIKMTVSDDKGGVLFQNNYRFSLAPSDFDANFIKPMVAARKPMSDPVLKSAYMPYYNTLGITVDTDLLGLDAKIRNASKVEVSLQRMIGSHDQNIAPDAGLEFAEASRDIPATHALQFDITVPPLEEGQYIVFLRLLDAENHVVYTKKEPFRRHKFAWEHNTLGSTLYPIPPFTRMTHDKASVSCLNRTYRFTQSGLFAGMTSEGTEVLSGPMELIGTVDGQQVSLVPEGDFTWVQEHPGQMIAIGKGRLGPIGVQVKSTTEYDGLTTFEITLDPTRRVKVSDMKLITKSPNAGVNCYLLMGPTSELSGDGVPTAPGVFWNSMQMTATANIRGRFLPYMYIGDGERGFCYFAVSDQGWMLDFDKASSFLERTATDTRLVLNLANTERDIDRPRTLTVAFEAVPVRPHTRNMDTEARNSRRSQYFTGYGGSNLSCMSLGPGTDQITMSDEDMEILRDQVLAAKRAAYPDYNVSVVKYTTHTVLGQGMKEFETYGGEWADQTVLTPEPRSEYAQLETAFGQFSPAGCTRQYADMTQSNVDMRVWALDQLQRRAGLNGYWWDHIPFWSSGSLVKGTAYQMDDGSTQGTLNLLLMRQMKKRMAVISYLNAMPLAQGNYAPGITPTTAFTSYLWAVEGLWYCMPNMDMLDNFQSLGRVRAYSGRWSGLPTTVTSLTQDQGSDNPFQSRSVIGLSLLHDLSIDAGRVDRKTLGRANQAMDAVNAGDRDAQWVPYWRSTPYVTINGGGQEVVATVYLKDGVDKKALVIVFNAGEQTEATVTLKGDAMLGRPIAKITNSETGQTIPASSPIKLSLKRHDYALLTVE